MRALFDLGRKAPDSDTKRRRGVGDEGRGRRGHPKRGGGRGDERRGLRLLGRSRAVCRSRRCLACLGMERGLPAG